MNESILNKFIEENYAKLLNALRRRFNSLNMYDAEDILQQTFVKLLSKGQGHLNVLSVSSYIYTSLQNTAIDQFRKNSRIILVDEDIDEHVDSVEDRVLLDELNRHIIEAIDQLDEKSKYVFVETEINGRTYEDLVEESGEKLGTLLSRKSRARKKLKGILENYVEVENK